MIKNYLLVAWKILLRRKFFTFISLFGICFTLTILLVVSSLLDHVFVPRSPESNFDRVLLLQGITTESPDGFSRHTSLPAYRFVEKYLRPLRGAEKVSVYTQQGVTMYNTGNALRLRIKRTDAAFWDILDFHFLEGRSFTYDEEQQAAPVAVINAEMRERLFHGERAENKTLLLEGQTYRIVGVVDNVPRFRSVAHADIWVPVTTIHSLQYGDELHGSFAGIVLAKHPRDFAQLKEEYQQQLRTVVFPDPKKFNVIKSTLKTQTEAVAGDIFSVESKEVYRFFGIAFFFVVLFLLLPAINLININMSRIMERSSEIGVRKSFGASSHTLAVQFVVENLVLVGIGGVLSLLFAWFVLLAIENSGVVPYAAFRLNYRIFSYAVVASVFFALFSGVYPAWRMSRMHPVVALKGGVA